MSAGIHTGEVELAGDEVTGTTVQITDRVAALARPRRSWYPVPSGTW